MNNICSRKLLRVFCRAKLCKKTLYSRLVLTELICEFHNQNLFVIVSACLASLQKVLNGKSDA